MGTKIIQTHPLPNPSMTKVITPSLVGMERMGLLYEYASRYETQAFIEDDPSQFMHKVEGVANREVTAFIASTLSYGSRKQFIPKIDYLLNCANGDMYGWVRRGVFAEEFRQGNKKAFYRLYSYELYGRFLTDLQHLLLTYNTIGDYVRTHAHDGLSAVQCLSDYFNKRIAEDDAASKDSNTMPLICAQGQRTTVIPKDTSSCCKRLCMFLRWMVRDNSPVDLGLWSGFIDKRTLIIPLDTHVLQEARRMGLMTTRATSMSAARQLTDRLAEVFPDDPLKGDFALFGVGVAG